MTGNIDDKIKEVCDELTWIRYMLLKFVTLEEKEEFLNTRTKYRYNK